MTEIPEAIKKFILEEHEATYRNFEKFNDVVGELFDKEEGTIGRVLKCHLIIEKHLNDLLVFHLNSKLDLVKLRLSFSQKVGILESISESFTIYGKGIREVNSLRNKIAHQLDYDINDSSLPWCSSMAEFFTQKKNLRKVEIVESFSFNICVILAESMTEYSQDSSRRFKEILKET